MNCKIEEDNKCDCKGYESYPLTLRVDMSDKEYSVDCSFYYKLGLEEIGSGLDVEGVVLFGGMSSRNIRDDEDSDDLQMKLEKDSLPMVVDYIKNKYPDKILTGRIMGVFETIYHQQRDYRLSEVH